MNKRKVEFFNINKNLRPDLLIILGTLLRT